MNRQLICINAFTLDTAPMSFTFTGPFEPAEAAITALRRAQRLRKITLGPLIERGFVNVAWVNPKESPGGGESSRVRPPAPILQVPDSIPSAVALQRRCSWMQPSFRTMAAWCTR
jgi:hypothetical protein